MSRAQLTSTVEQNTGGAVSPYVAGKNAIINGGMDIWQRGTSFAGAASGTSYNADRWLGYRGATNSTFSQQSAGSTLPQFKYCQRIQRTSADTQTSILIAINTLETIESLRFAGQSATISFYARAGANYSAASSAFNATLYGGTGTDNNGSSLTSAVAQVSGTATLTTSWQRFSYTGTVTSDRTQLALWLYYTPTGTAGANDYVEITGVQLEAGSVATPFSRAGGTLSGELAACQRYFQKLSVTTGQSGELLGFGTAFSSTSVPITISVPVTMRILPSLTVSGGTDFRLYDGASAPTTSGMTLYTGNTGQAITINAASSGLTQFRPYYLIPANAVAAYIQLSAEL